MLYNSSMDIKLRKKAGGSPEKYERNYEVYLKKMDGVSYTQLSREYDLSVPRILKIVNRYRKTKNGYTTRDDK